MIVECIKEGFHITNKNWQVVLIKVVVFLINFAALFIFIGIPIVLAITSLGINISNTTDWLADFFENPSEIFSKYFGAAVFIIISFILYLTIASILILYAFAGMLGVLRNSAINEQYRFSLHSFFEESRKFFFPLLWLFSVSILMVLGIFIVFGIIAGILISFSESSPALSLFATYFLGLLGIACGVSGIIFSAYAAIALVVERGKVMSAFNNALKFIKYKPFAFLFYLILVIGIMIINFVLLLIGTAFGAAPVIGFIISIPYQIMFSIAQSYLFVVMWCSLLIYYLRIAHGASASSPSYDI
ncbi:MAG: hypothetical protein HY758_08340 [Nitrospirae bacterium]|nr:hypothetical protein [Nitrospirota bacterium]